MQQDTEYYYTWTIVINLQLHRITVLARDVEHAKRKAWALLHKAKYQVDETNKVKENETKGPLRPLYGSEKTNTSKFVLFHQGCYCEDLGTVLEEFKKVMYDVEPIKFHKNSLVITSCLDG